MIQHISQILFVEGKPRQCYFSFERFRNTKGGQKYSQRGVVLVITMPRKKGSGTPFQLASF
jgi:hypothetical protein